MSGNLLCCLKGVNDSFQAQEGRWDFSEATTAEQGLISLLGEILLVFLELCQQTWGPSRVTTGTTGNCSQGYRNGQSPCELRGASQDSSAVASGAEVLI